MIDTAQRRPPAGHPTHPMPQPITTPVARITAPEVLALSLSREQDATLQEAVPQGASDAERAELLAQHAHDLIAERRELEGELRAARLTIEGLTKRLTHVVESQQHPVAVSTFTDADTGVGIALVICRNGAVFRKNATESGREWMELPPIPGSPLAIAREGRADA